MKRQHSVCLADFASLILISRKFSRNHCKQKYHNSSPNHYTPNRRHERAANDEPNSRNQDNRSPAPKKLVAIVERTTLVQTY